MAKDNFDARVQKFNAALVVSVNKLANKYNLNKKYEDSGIYQPENDKGQIIDILVNEITITLMETENDKTTRKALSEKTVSEEDKKPK